MSGSHSHGQHTIHCHHHHHGWDNSIKPVLKVAPGSVVELETIDSSGGQIDPSWTVADMGKLDFARVSAG